MDPLYLFFGANYLAQGLIGVAYEPLSYLLKDGLGLSAGQSAAFVSWMSLPFVAKPLLGAASDLLAERGLGRAAQLRLAAAAAAAAWIASAAWGRPSAGGLLALMILANAGLAASDVACDAVMVEQGQARRKTGVYQAVQIGVLYLTLVVTGLGGGFLAKHAAPSRVFALTAIFPALILLSATWAGEEGRSRRGPAALAGLRVLLASPRAWALAAFIFLWSFNPLLGTAMFYYQANALKLDPVFIGLLSTLAGVAGVLGAAAFGRRAAESGQGKGLIRASVVFGAPLTLLYLLYRGPASAAVLTVLFGFLGVVFRLALMDLAAASAPAGAEAASFAAYMAVFNAAAWASNAAGGALYDRFLGLAAASPDPAWSAVAGLALIGCACTAACWPLLKYLPGRGAARAA